jgi:site-specific DNA-cytosine methylase
VRILIACEFSGVVREAFRARGHDAWSCDFLPPDDGSEFHLKGDCFNAINNFQWDMMIAHPPCTHLSVSGARWFKDKLEEQRLAILFFMGLATTDIEKIAIENPIGVMSIGYRKPDQIIQPWQFGHGETKATCLWLKNLPKLQPTNIVEGREAKIHKMPPSKDRGKLRSITYKGIAEAMANQWG